MNKEIRALKKYFSDKEDVVAAFLFGSQAKGIAGKISDWDIAVYFRPQEPGRVEWEETGRDYPQEYKIWDDVIDIVKTDNVDLVVLNRCAPNIAASAIKGIPLVIKDRRIFLDFLLLVNREAEDYYSFVNDYYEIRQRSSSLNVEDRARLQRIISFLQDEIELYDYFISFTIEDYKDVHKRHEIERWIENMVNSSLDVGEIILASEKKRMPDSYRDVFVNLGFLPQFKGADIDKFTEWVKLRNILAHEYLDIKWRKINNFTKESKPCFERFLGNTKKFL